MGWLKPLQCIKLETSTNMQSKNRSQTQNICIAYFYVFVRRIHFLGPGQLDQISGSVLNYEQRGIQGLGVRVFSQQHLWHY